MVLDEALALAWAAAGDAMAISDPDGVVLLANPAYHALYGYGPDQVIDRSFAVIFPEGERAAAEAAYRAVFHGPAEVTDVEAVVRRVDGGERAVEARYSFLMRGKRRTAMRSTVRDITQRKHLEATLREEVATLETLNRTGQQVAAELDLRVLVQTVTDAATALTSAAFRAFFYNVTDMHGESYTLYALAGVPQEVFADFPMPRNTAIFGPTFRGEGVVRLADVTADRATATTRRTRACRRGAHRSGVTSPCRSSRARARCWVASSSATPRPVFSPPGTSDSWWAWPGRRRWPSTTPGSSRRCARRYGFARTSSPSPSTSCAPRSPR